MRVANTIDKMAAGIAKYMEVYKLVHAKYPDPITIVNNRKVLFTVPSIVILSV